MNRSSNSRLGDDVCVAAYSFSDIGYISFNL